MPKQERKRESYQRLTAYKKVFLDPAGNFTPEAEIIMADLAKFADLLGFVPLEAMKLAAAQGKREMLHYILYQTGTSESELMKQLKRIGELKNG